MRRRSKRAELEQARGLSKRELWWIVSGGAWGTRPTMAMWIEALRRGSFRRKRVVISASHLPLLESAIDYVLQATRNIESHGIDERTLAEARRVSRLIQAIPFTARQKMFGVRGDSGLVELCAAPKSA